MLLLTMLLLSASPNTLVGATAVTPEIGKAPAVPQWPADLPPPQVHDGTVCLASPMAAAVHRRLLYLDRYPQLCQAAIDGARSVDREDFEGSLRVQRAEHAAEKRDQQSIMSNWRDWQVALVMVGTAVLAGAMGYGVGVLLQ